MLRTPLAAATVLFSQVLLAMGIDTASLPSRNGSPLGSKNTSERRHRMKSRASEGSTEDNKSPQSEQYNQRRMVRVRERALQLTCLCHCCGPVGRSGKFPGDRAGSTEIRGMSWSSDSHPDGGLNWGGAL